MIIFAQLEKAEWDFITQPHFDRSSISKIEFLVIESLSGLEANVLWKCGAKSVDKTATPKPSTKVLILYLLSASSDITKTESFIEKLNSLDKSISYYVYCRSGQRSSKACYLMEQLGIKTTYNLVGGALEWKGELVK